MRGKIILSILFIVLLNTAKAQVISLPDTNFVRFLREVYPRTLDANNRLLIAEAAKVRGTFNCSNRNIKDAEGIQYFTGISILSLSNNLLETIPDISPLNLIEELYITNNKLKTVPSLLSLNRLREFYAGYNQLEVCPDFSKNDSLRVLWINNNRIPFIQSIDNLSKLNSLDVYQNGLTRLPPLENLKSLQRLICAKNLLKTLPPPEVLKNLIALDASHNLLESFPYFPPDNVIQNLHLNDNKIDVLPDTLRFDNLVKLWLYYNDLTYRELLKLTSFRNYANLIVLSPQNVIHVGRVFSGKRGETLKLYTGVDNGVDNVQYEWSKNGRILKTVVGDTLSISNVQYADTGAYMCRLRHPTFPGVVISTDTFFVKITDCIDPAAFSVSSTPISCHTQGTVSVLGTVSQDLIFTLRGMNSGNAYTSSTGNFQGLSESLFSLYITFPYGCETQFHSQIKIPKESCPQVLITPNGDGQDDRYFFEQSGSMTVYNKNGDIIKTLSLPAEWDGTTSSGLAPPGFYLGNINGGQEKINISIVY